LEALLYNCPYRNDIEQNSYNPTDKKPAFSVIVLLKMMLSKAKDNLETI
jgi:hypothetical protein